MGTPLNRKITPFDMGCSGSHITEREKQKDRGSGHGGESMKFPYGISDFKKIITKGGINYANDVRAGSF